MSSLPTPYDRKHVFGSASSNNPSKPIQGTDLDAEYNAIEKSMDTTQARLAEIQRDDGGLANGSVHVETLGPDVVEWLADQTVEWSEEAMQPILDEMNQLKADAAQSAADAAASEAAAEQCRDQSCECAADSQLFAIESESHADDSQASSVDSAASADMARYYYEQMSGTLDALAPQTIVVTTVAATSSIQLPVSVSDEQFLDVYDNGAHLTPDKYNVVGSTLNLTPAIPGGHTVTVKIASSVQIMPIVVDDWGYVWESIASAEDWGPIAA